MRKDITISTVDEYLEMVESDDARNVLTSMRAIILDEIPEAEEVISYGIPIYKHHGMVAGFAAFKKHCSFFPGHTVADFMDELAKYKTSKGTVQFQPKDPLPEALIRAIVRKRFEENAMIAIEKSKK
jgi:uncharacterized protein YdhG (YjbR/CyaY superfamily)